MPDLASSTVREHGFIQEISYSTIEPSPTAGTPPAPAKGWAMVYWFGVTFRTHTGEDYVGDQKEIILRQDVFRRLADRKKFGTSGNIIQCWEKAKLKSCLIQCGALKIHAINTPARGMNYFFEHFSLVTTGEYGHEIGGEIREMSDEVADSIFEEMLACIRQFYPTEHSQCPFRRYVGEIDCRVAISRTETRPQLKGLCIFYIIRAFKVESIDQLRDDGLFDFATQVGLWKVGIHAIGNEFNRKGE